MTNIVNSGDVVLTLVLLAVLVLLLLAGFIFELAGETVPGWHTISWWAHRDRRVRLAILVGIGVLALGLIVGLGFHFGNRIAR